MKLKIAYVGFLLAAATFVLTLTSSAPSPDTLLMGTWQEVSWEYEKVDPFQKPDSVSGKQITDSVKQTLSQDMIVHQAERWHFLPDGALRLLSDQQSPRRLHWKMKGRGHILVLHYDNQLEEGYTVAELTENRMVLHFYTEMQARGIAKITFTRIN